MAIRQILTYPHPVLKEKSVPVTVFDDDLHALLEDMIETTKSTNGLGLAAPQVGVSKRLFILDFRLPPEDYPDEMMASFNVKRDTYEIINPVLVLKEGHMREQESCLSVPGFSAFVDRYETVELDFQDRFGKSQKVLAHGLFAKAIQHEFDHLEGVLYFERIKGVNKVLIKKKIKKKIEEKGSGYL